MANSPQVILALVYDACKTEDKSILQLVYEVEPFEEETGERVMNRYMAIQKLTECAKLLGFSRINDLNTNVAHKTRLAVTRRAMQRV